MASERPARGFIGVTLAVQRRFGLDDGTYLAASVAFFGFLSLFPLLLLGLAVVGFVLAGDPRGQAEWSQTIAGAVPGLGPLIGRNIEVVIEARGVATITGLAGLLWSGTGVTEASSRAMRVVFRVPRQEGFLKKKAWSLAVTAGLGVLALTGTVAATLAGGLERTGSLGPLIALGGTVLALGVDMGLFLVAYRILIKRPGPPFPRLWPGALFAALAWTALKLGGAWYTTRQVEGSSAVYGTFAVTVGVLLLLFLAARVFVYGAELNAVLMERGGRDMQKNKSPSENGYEAWSTGDLVKGIAGDTATLVRKEVELAKQEVVEGITGKLKGGGAFAAAGVIGLIAIVFLGSALASALDLAMPAWASRLIVAGVFVAAAAGAAMWGKTRMTRGSVTAEETRRTVKEDVTWAREQLKR